MVEWLTKYLAPIVVFGILVAMTIIGGIHFKGWKRKALIILGVLAIIVNSYITIESVREQQANEKREQQKEEMLRKANKKLDDLMLMITQKIPGLEGLESYDSIIAALKNIELRTTTLEKETQKTTFKREMVSEKLLPDGKYEVRFDLIPTGKNIVPLLKIICNTNNQAKILKFSITSNNRSLGIFYKRSNQDETAIQKIFKIVEPRIINVVILTDKKPQPLDCDWEPKD